MYCENSSTTEKKRTGKTKANSKQQNQGGVKPVRRSCRRVNLRTYAKFGVKREGGGGRGDMSVAVHVPFSDPNAHMHRTQTKT